MIFLVVKMRKIIIFISLLLMPIMVYASDDYEVLNHYIDSEIEISGNLRVKELIIVKGTLNSFKRTLNYQSFPGKWDNSTVNLDNGSIYNGQSIINFKTAAYKFTDKEVDFNDMGANIKKYFTKLDPMKPQDNTYNEDDQDGYNIYTTYYKVKDETVAFYYEYLISNVVVVHKDVQELNYTFKNLTFNSENTLIRVIIPYATNSKLYNVYVHGNQSGKVQKLLNDNKENLGILLSFPTIKKEVNIRITLPKEQVGIDIYLNHSNIKAIDKIKQIEEEKANNTNRGKNFIKASKYLILILSILYVLFSIIFIKYKDNLLFIIYLILGLILSLFNYLFKFNLIYLYFLVIIPLIFKLVKIKKRK
jgi:hypothetical protein